MSALQTPMMPAAEPAPSGASRHAALIQALNGEKAEAALASAIDQMSRGGDIALLAACVQAMSRSGMAGAGLRLAQSAGAAARTHPLLRTAIEPIESAASGALHESAMRERYRSNAAIALLRWPRLAAILNPAEPPRGVSFFTSRTGNMHALRDREDGGFAPVFPFVDHLQQVAALKMPAATLETSFALIGLPSEALLSRLLATECSGYRPPIDILESDAEALCVWLCMLSDGALLRDPRLGVFIGSDAAALYADWLSATPSRTLPAIVLTCQRAGCAAPPARLDAAWRSEVEGRAAARRVRIRDEVQQRFTSRDVPWWRQRFAEAGLSQPPLRIVGFTSRWSTVIGQAMQRLAEAFARNGRHRFDVVSQADACSPMIDVAGTLASGEFDLIVAINHLRFEYADSMPANVPFVGWIQDHMDHLWSPRAGGSVGDLELVVAHAPDVLSGLYGYRRDRLLGSSNLTDAATFSPEPMKEADLAPYRCDLSYASHGAATPEALVEELAAATTPAFGAMMRMVLGLLRERMQQAGCLNACELVEVMLEAERASRHPALPAGVRRATVYPQVARVHDRLLRHQTLEWAATWARSRNRRLRFFGRGWSLHPTLAEFAAGEVEGAAHLRAAYQASRISLQANAYSSLHQRLLDGVACGAMVISRRNPADFVRRPFTRIAETINTRGLMSMADATSHRRTDRGFAEVCAEAERLSGAVIACEDDPKRRRQIEVMRAANDIADLQSDAGLFLMLRDMRYLPVRTAGDLPGFDRTVFESEAQMHSMLDGLVDDEPLRRTIVEPMRADVLAHDTFDALARRIIAAFASGVAS